VTFILAMIGIVLGLIAGLVTSHTDFVQHFNSYVVAAGGHTNAYATVMKNAPAPAGFSLQSTYFAMIWTIYMVVFGSASAYIGGEVRRPGLTQRWGMIGSLILTGVAIAVILAVLDKTMSNEFLAGLAGTPAANLGLASNPNYNELLTAAIGPNLF